MSVCKTGKIYWLYQNQFLGVDIILQLDKMLTLEESG